MIVDGLQHMQSFERHDHPGPVDGSRAHGPLWDEDCQSSDRTFSKTADMQGFMNSRMFNRRINLEGMKQGRKSSLGWKRWIKDLGGS